MLTGSEGDGAGNTGDRTNGTIADEAPKASVRKVLGPKAAVGEEILGGLLHHRVSQTTIPFSATRH
jgi:hypothetical protein